MTKMTVTTGSGRNGVVVVSPELLEIARRPVVQWSSEDLGDPQRRAKCANPQCGAFILTARATSGCQHPHLCTICAEAVQRYLHLIGYTPPRRLGGKFHGDGEVVGGSRSISALGGALPLGAMK
ncbi:MAG: hypothetical protein HY420_03955 [Candidatus Kerfeldbacteria bacterium]|nr:hypothetical protein [Candidatus Kerfeldbacteria bacterium]